MKRTLLFIFSLSVTSIFAQSWNIAGNSGTNSSIHFMGTTDNTPVIFKQNNQQMLKLGWQHINIGSGVPGTGELQFALSPCDGCFSQWAKPNDAVIRLLDGNNLNIHMDNDNAIDPNSDTSTPNSSKITRVRFSDAVHKNLMVLFNTGKVTVGTDQYDSDPNFIFYVSKGIKAEQVKVENPAKNGWADYVFKKDYKLRSLVEVEQHIAEKGHLPNIPSEKEGINLGEMDAKLLEKIEELTLYSIEQNKQLKLQSAEIQTLKEQVQKLLSTKK
ncbi:cell wall anchor protein [Chryseobacterium lactis]|uniref:Cell wall anchor protein n=1 Tax=Chryseobacterium lactis TaxID=1241981 RepID=A0A3G6RYV3_CHRLC|nr:cell wall anchor protein [Chryseobacterium lactis]AZA81772.1 cell wall anchor protein [Chryseobacterium lactis]AZB06770.1 cell wall anchor protein [Chryseobacterium lactis]PNW15622.1 cell wall anchor protein [Chryseobacterium lactis]